jgi:hypothetical protein
MKTALLLAVLSGSAFAVTPGQVALALRHEGSAADGRVVAVVLANINRELPRYFPKGPFTAADIVAIGMVETRFNPRSIGTSGERGVFQVMPYYGKGRNLAELSLNTRLCLKILAGKYREHPDRRRAVIAYNGYIVRHGKLRENYWRLFCRQRALLIAFAPRPARRPMVAVAEAEKLAKDIGA